MPQHSEEPRLGDYPVILERLEIIYQEKLRFFRALAKRLGVRPGDEGEVVHDTYLTMLKLKPQGEIEELLAHWEETTENLARLDEALTALFVYYLKLTCSKWRRTNNVNRPLPAEPGPETDSFLQLEVLLVLGRLDHLVDEMHDGGEVTEVEWRYWHWLRQNLGGRVEDFARSLNPPRKPGGWIKRTAVSLFRKICRRVTGGPP
jgi:hypothetical protein